MNINEERCPIVDEAAARDQVVDGGRASRPTERTGGQDAHKR